MLPRRVLIGSLPSAVVLTLAATLADRLPGDLWLSRHLQDIGKWYEPIAEAARAVTTTQTVLILGFMLGFAMFVAGERRLAAACFTTIAVLPFVQAGIKNVVDRPRPSPSLVERRATFTSESFPSGHAMSGTVLFLLIVLVLVSANVPRWLRHGGLAFAAVILVLSMVGDVYLGMHWPSDVLGGFLWALALVGLAWSASRLAAKGPGA